MSQDVPSVEQVLAGVEVALPETLAVLPLRDTVVFPLAVVPISVGQERSIRLVDEVMKGDRLLALVKQKHAEPRPAGPDDCHEIGVAATIHQMRRGSDGGLRLIVQGVARIRLTEFRQTEPYLVASIVRADEVDDASIETEGLARSVKDLFRRLATASAEVPEIVSDAVASLEDPRQLAYVVGATVPISSEDRQALLEIDSVHGKLARLVTLLQHEIAVRDLGERITTQTQEKMSKAQRDFWLREQIKTMQRELGDEGGGAAVGDLRETLAKVPLHDEARREVERELSRLERTPEASPEHGVIRTFLEWVAALPWGKTSEAGIDVEKARRVLDEDHHDLEKPKERIIEYLAVRKLRKERSGNDGEADRREPILCFVGPPGVGKTSLALSIARALGRETARVSLGGVHDEAEIRGHRRTYIGAMPGRILQGLRRCGTMDPVFILDEVDKLGVGIQGDPSAALLEVLDPAQNGTFVDTYLGVPFDLSKVLFICTANNESQIPQPLQDRMETINLPGYTEQDKLVIARRHLLPRQLRANALRDGELEIDDAALARIVGEYTREAGVRNLERSLAQVCRKAALQIAASEATTVHVTADDLPRFIGPPRLAPNVAERIDRPGVATGLAWTPAGGDILFVEATVLPSKHGKLVLTGSLGEVMRESAQAALSWVRSRAETLGIDPTVFDERDIHIHVPSGAIPKDGPSAGVTIVTALASAVSQRLVRHDVAMTGEITLRGKVLPIGGIKEKALAAHRAGIRVVILPKWNMVDVEEIPADLRKELEFVPVETVDEVLARALSPVPEATAART